MTSLPEICTTPLDGSTALSSAPLNTSVMQAEPGDQDVPKDLNALTANNVLLQLPAKLDTVTEELRSLSHKMNDKEERDSWTDDKSKGKSWQSWPIPVSAHVAMCNFEQFKTVFAIENTRCAIEALLWNPMLKSEIEDFMASCHIASSKRDHHVERAKGLDVSDTETLNAFPPRETWIQEVRVNSRAVLSVLERVGYNEDMLVKEPHIFRRPFRYFFENHDKIHEELRKSEACASLPLGHKDFDSDISQVAKELRCYFDFVEKYIMPKYRELQEDGFAKTQKITFDNLYFMFRPGELLYVPPSATRRNGLPGPSAQRRSTGVQTIVRLRHLSRWGGESKGIEFRSLFDHFEYRIRDKLRVSCHYIEFDGERYGAVMYKVLEIPRFHEACHITELPFYPARFMDNLGKVLEEAKEHGGKMVALLSDSAKHAHYSGWTMINGPLGHELQDSKGDPVRFPEHIESDIIVDYDETFKHNPGWKPSIVDRDSAAGVSFHICTDSVHSVKWPTSSNELLTKYDELLVQDDFIHYCLWNEYRATDIYCKEDTDSSSPVRPQDLALLPRLMVAYSLWDRKFVQIDSHFVHNRTREGQEGQSFQQLQIQPQSKDVIESLLYNHFNNMKAEKAGIVVESQDLIRGKGRGVSILLHGKPGVGKTATAEAVAEKWQRPLFPITCGDLGYQADHVEKSLNEIFRLAHLWGCVLLLDEADIFITQRTQQELQRNALVSVFLRMLEYYNGILFLTTNRTGVLEAIKSRIHLHLGFDDLDEHQTVEIFKNNIARLRARDQQRIKAMPGQRALMIDDSEIISFARAHFQKHSTAMGRWNGRQIRNAFVVASSLATFQADKKSPEWQPQLRVEHFNTVLDATLKYDRYRQSILLESDDAMAFKRMERAEPMAMPPLSGTYGSVQNGVPFPLQQQQQQQVVVPTSLQYGGAAGAAFQHAAMPPSTGNISHNPDFTHRTQIPEQMHAGLYSGQSAVNSGRVVLNTHEQDRVYLQQHLQPGFNVSTTAQSVGGAQAQEYINSGGSSHLHTGLVDPVYTSVGAIAPGARSSGQEQTQTPQMQYGGMQGSHGRAGAGEFQGRP